MSKYYSIHEFSKIIGVSAQTLRNWDANGKLHPHHTTVSGYRYYSDEQLNQVINVKPKNALQLDIVAFPAINKKMIWNNRLIMLKHIFINTIFLNQFGVCSKLFHFPVFKYHDQIGMLYRGNSVCDQDCCFSFTIVPEIM